MNHTINLMHLRDNLNILTDLVQHCGSTAWCINITALRTCIWGLKNRHARTPSRALHFSLVLTLCFWFGCLPEYFLTGQLIPILNKAQLDCSAASSYRPITVSIMLSKLPEVCTWKMFSVWDAAMSVWFCFWQGLWNMFLLSPQGYFSLFLCPGCSECFQ